MGSRRKLSKLLRPKQPLKPKYDDQGNAADFESFRKDFAALQAADGEVGLQGINPADLSWAEMDAFYQLRWLEREGFPEADLTRFQDKLQRIMGRENRSPAKISYMNYVKSKVWAAASKLKESKQDNREKP